MSSTLKDVPDMRGMDDAARRLRLGRTAPELLAGMGMACFVLSLSA